MKEKKVTLKFSAQQQQKILQHLKQYCKPITSLKRKEYENEKKKKWKNFKQNWETLSNEHSFVIRNTQGSYSEREKKLSWIEPWNTGKML